MSKREKRSKGSNFLKRIDEMTTYVTFFGVMILYGSLARL
jgi:hypothetical protein